MRDKVEEVKIKLGTFSVKHSRHHSQIHLQSKIQDFLAIMCLFLYCKSKNI